MNNEREELREPFERFIVRAGFTDWTRHGDGYLKPLVDRLWRAWPGSTQASTHAQISELDDASNACLELAAKHGFATGHGDTVGDMIREFCAQIVTPVSSTLHCPNGLEHGNCLHPNCVSSCPGRLSLAPSKVRGGE